MLSGAESVTERLVDFPSSWHFFCVVPEVSSGKTVSRNNGLKTSRHCISASWRYTDATRSVEVPQTALQRETGGFTVLGCGSNYDVQLLAEKILPKKSAAVPAVFETFLEHCQTGKEPLSDYSVVDFSM